MSASLTHYRQAAERLIADTLTFRRSLNVQNSDAARRNIHYAELENFDEALPQREERPAVVLLHEAFAYDQIGQGSIVDMGASGGVVGLFMKNSLNSLDPKEVANDFDDWLGGILDEIASMVGRNDYFPFRSVQLIEGPYRSSMVERETDDYWCAVVLFQHNVNP